MPLSSLGTSLCLALRVQCMQIGYPADLSCAPRFLTGLPKGASCPFGNAPHPCGAPNGLNRSKAPVLGAAYGEKTIPVIGGLSRDRRAH